MPSSFLNCLHVPYFNFPTTATLAINFLRSYDGEAPLPPSIYKTYMCAGK